MTKCAEKYYEDGYRDKNKDAWVKTAQSRLQDARTSESMIDRYIKDVMAGKFRSGFKESVYQEYYENGAMFQ